MEATGALQRGRDACAHRAWRDAFEDLTSADNHEALPPEDLVRLGTAAYLIGREDESVAALERAHHAYLDEGEVGESVHCAFWIGMTLMLRGRHAEGGGWLGRAGHVLQEDPREVERGFLLIPQGLQELFGGDSDAALQTFTRAGAIADESDAPDLVALSRLGLGQTLVAQGERERAVPVLDETMVVVTTDDVSPIVAGIVYCALILACRAIFDLGRAQEWTLVLSRWCADQQDLQPYRGQCLIHRSELMQLSGEWTQAMEEVDQACAHLGRSPTDPVLGMAHYQRGELLRLRGRFADAELAYRRAHEFGHPVHPGLALLRLAQGRVAEADAAVRRVLAEAGEDRVQRARVLAAFVEIVLAAQDVPAARPVVTELHTLAETLDSDQLRALATTAEGSVLLADDDAAAANVVLATALTVWHRLNAPYEVAGVRVLLARACARLGDHDTARIELDAAQRVFEQLSAGPALARVARLRTQDQSAEPDGLTPREVEVMRHLATGATNREIAQRLVISDKTVARHVSNIFTKLGLVSRSAATDYAHRHDLV